MADHAASMPAPDRAESAASLAVPAIDIAALADRLYRKRKGRGLTLAQAGQQIGVSAATLSRLERRRRERPERAGQAPFVPDARTLAAVARWVDPPPASGAAATPEPAAVVHHPGESVPEMVEAHLRADRTLDDEAALALAQLFHVAYDHFSRLGAEAHAGGASDRGAPAAADVAGALDRPQPGARLPARPAPSRMAATARGVPGDRLDAAPPRDASGGGEGSMKWVTRAGARMDRAAMVWLIRRSIDPEAEFVFLPESEVMEFAAESGATPFHHPKAELRNTGVRTGFDALRTHYQLDDPALAVLALIIRGAETQDRQLTPWSTGFWAIGSGLRNLHEDDATYVAAIGDILDGLYRFCQDTLAQVARPAAARRE